MELPLVWTQKKQLKKPVYNAKLERIISPFCVSLDRASADILYDELKGAKEIKFQSSLDYIACVDFVDAYELMTIATLDTLPLWCFVKSLGGRLAARIKCGRIVLVYAVESHE
ncbi:hypothetical protein [Pseudomonas sp. PD9R]|uniref:hypothetical protein n=1 Tax=Pseudomonas sp. PD9R TaxID=2853534 RepID=UPI001C43E47C|nr:hypothetical protein [Pseudomonas sp. PD9R]MBV6824497.1 hypothetical protein [Pseudomonas sp. PD9R]